LVRCMTTSAMDVARAAASHCKRGYGSVCRLKSKMVAMMTPIRPLKKWPKTRARGCASGTSIAP
jgi:hypothetical protein